MGDLVGYGVKPLKVSGGTCDMLQKDGEDLLRITLTGSGVCSVLDISSGLTWNFHIDCATANANQTPVYPT